MVGIKTDVTLSRTLYIDVEESDTEEQILEKAKKEIMLPVNALYQADLLLRNMRVNNQHLDLKDWDTTNVEYTIIK